jgi:methyl-accepting chemotaxis protein/methyl-accepting chemotaxis protein-1 (serine sensor receptor)
VLVDEVKQGSEEQARGIQQISEAISRMEQVTQRSAACAQQGASAGEAMSAQAETLREVAQQLQRMVGGRDSVPRQAESPILPRPGARHATAPRTVKTSARLKPPSAVAAPLTTQQKSDAFPMDEDFKEF